MTFQGTSHELAGSLHEPAGPVSGGVVLAHCFTCSKDYSIMTRLASSLQEGGYAVLRFDFTGLGESGGSFARTTFGSDVGDLTRAALWMVERGYGACAMVGHSLGGAATLVAATKTRPVRGVAVVNALSDPKRMRALVAPGPPPAADATDVMVEIAGRRFPISRRLLEDLDRFDSSSAISDLGRPLLVIHSVEDRTVPVSEGERIFALARQPKAFEPLLGADHLLSDPATTAIAGALLVGWLDRML